MKKMCSLIFLFFMHDFLQEMIKTVNKGKFETYQHTGHFLDKICPLYCHHHIKSGRKCFSRANSTNSQSSSLLNLASQNAGNNPNYKTNDDHSDTGTFLPLESERNKAKIDSQSDQQIQVLRNMWKQ